MNIASSYTVLAVRRGSSGFCKVECSPRSWRGILVLRKLIGLDGDEEPPLYMTYQPLAASVTPQEASALLALSSPWVILGNNGTRKVWGILEERQWSNSQFQIDLLRHLYICTVSKKPPKTRRYWLLVFNSLHAHSLHAHRSLPRDPSQRFCWEGSLGSHLAQYPCL